MTASPAAATAGDVFQVFRVGETLTRAEIIERTGLSRSTAALRLDELVGLGLVGAHGAAGSSGGRPPKLFGWRPEARVVAGVDFGASHAAVVLTDLAGTILAREGAHRPIAEGPADSIRWLGEVVRRMLYAQGREPRDLLAIGIGLPGPVAWPSGRPASPPIMPGWDGVDVPGLVVDELGVFAVVDNDVNVMAVGERSAAWPEVTDLLFVKVATGIGSGIISGGLLQRGADGVAGDIGHARLSRGRDVACVCGDTGCLEAMASAPAIVTVLRERGLDVADGDQLAVLTRDGDPLATEAVLQAGRDIGEVLATGIRYLNPEIVVIGGSMARCGEPLLQGVRDVLEARSTPGAARGLRVELSHAGPDAALLGASRLAVDAALEPARIDAMPL